MNTWQAGAAAAMGVWATMGGVLAPYRAVLHTAEHHQAENTEDPTAKSSKSAATTPPNRQHGIERVHGTQYIKRYQHGATLQATNGSRRRVSHRLSGERWRAASPPPPRAHPAASPRSYHAAISRGMAGDMSGRGPQAHDAQMTCVCYSSRRRAVTGHEGPAGSLLTYGLSMACGDTHTGPIRGWGHVTAR